MTLIKICGLFRSIDIAYANQAKPDYIGFILNVGKSHRNLSIEQALELRKGLDAGIQVVGVFVDENKDVILEASRRIGLDVIQLHGSESNGFIEDLKTSTQKPIWKAFKVKDARDIQLASLSKADMVLLDGGSGDGLVFDWSLLKDFNRPFILAGGLKIETIKEALGTGAAILDLSSGVESDGVKDLNKMIAVVTAVRKEGR